MEWFEELPVSCPPYDAVPPQGEFYRIVRDNPAKSEDFVSLRKLNPEKNYMIQGVDECVLRAVSLFKDEIDAVKRLKLPKFKHCIVACVTLQPKD